MTEPTIELVRHEPRKDVVEALEELLERARAGQIAGLCVCAELIGRETATSSVGDFGMFSMIGALHVLAQQLGREVLDDEPGE